MRCREVGPVGCVGPGLRLKADGVGLPIKPTTLSGRAAVEIVPRIDLQTGLIGVQFEHAARAWIGEPRGEARLIACPGKTEIVIIAAAISQLRMIVADARTDLGAGTKIERGAGNGAGRLLQRNRGGVDREKIIRGDGKAMIENVARRACPGQIEEAMIGEIDHGRTVGPRRHVERELHRRRQTPRHLYLQRAGITLFAIGAGAREGYRRTSALLDRDNPPNVAIEALGSAMQRIGSIIGRKLHHLTVEHEARPRDTVGITPDGRAEE